MQTSYSAFFSAFTLALNSRVPALGLPACAASSSATTGAAGRRVRPAKVRWYIFGYRYPSATMSKCTDMLLLEEDPGDVRLALAVFGELDMVDRCVVVGL